MIRFIVAAYLAMISCSPAFATIRIDVSYDTVANEMQPEVKQITGRGGTSIILNNDGSVTKYMNGMVSTNSINGYVSSITRDKTTSISHYKLSNGAITEFFENDGVRSTISISTNGASYCTARASFRPGRGQRYIIWSRDTQTYVSMERAINVVCRVQKLN